MDASTGDASTADASAGDAPGAIDASVTDGGPADAAIECMPNTWSCSAPDAASYCNALGDGFLRTVPCTEGCADGRCNPAPGFANMCGTLRNGVRGVLIGGMDCPSVLSSTNAGYQYGIWLEEGDEVVVRGTSLSPLSRAEAWIAHHCTPGIEGACAEEDLSEPGGEAVARYTATRREQLRVGIRAGPPPNDGARVEYEVSLVPGAALPSSPMVCTPGETRCLESGRAEYCSDDGRFRREYSCWDDNVNGVVACEGNECVTGPGPSCNLATPIVRPPNDRMVLDSNVSGLIDDFDPGPDCFGIGQSGPDRAWRLSLRAGERIRLEAFAQLVRGIAYSVYILRGDCSRPTESCVAGAVGHQYFEEVGRTTVRPEFEYTAPTDETLYIVADYESSHDQLDELRYLRIFWTGTCSDGIANGDETDIDCGGPCGGCPDGQMCDVDSDCASRRCGETTSRRCDRPAGCGDGVIAAREFCDDGNLVDGDFCSSSCISATCDDGILNGDETAVDTGGYCLRAEHDVCERSQELVIEPPPRFDYYTRDVTGNLAGAAADNRPSCGTFSPDHAYRLVVRRRTRITAAAYRWTAGDIDESQRFTVSLRRGCGGPEVDCVAGAGLQGFMHTLDPGVYVLWVNDQGAGGDYVVTVDGDFP
ncbi:MAG: hypothetical protein AAGF12_28485 [Myxococcota bacterium]